MLHLGVIRREEEYLEDCFEGEYLAYKAKVPRWIPGLLQDRVGAEILVPRRVP